MCTVVIVADQLHVLFSQDPNFSKSLFEKQMSVMRGQVRDIHMVLAVASAACNFIIEF
jgi:hypothetical protein